LFSFVLLHLVMVLLSGPINGIRSMITGNVRQAPQGDMTGVES
jgi:thiosulfate reductase cytochrome b subunit